MIAESIGFGLRSGIKRLRSEWFILNNILGYIEKVIAKFEQTGYGTEVSNKLGQ